MSRQSGNIVIDGVLKSGYDYDLQVWVEDYIIQDCGHPTNRKGCCNARRFVGRDIRTFKYDSTGSLKVPI